MRIEQQVGGSQIEEDARIGYPRQITIDTDTWTVRVHDGITPGGHKILPEELMAVYSSMLFTALENHGVPGALPAAGTLQNKLNLLNATGDYVLPSAVGFTAGRPMLFQATAAGVTLSVSTGQIWDNGGTLTTISIAQNEIVTITRRHSVVFLVTNRYGG